MSVNIRDLSVEELEQLNASMSVYERQLVADIALHRAEIDRLEARLFALTVGAADDEQESVVADEDDGPELYLSDAGKKVKAGTKYDVLDGDDNVVAHLIGKGRSWTVLQNGLILGRGSSKQAAINDFVGVSA